MCTRFKAGKGITPSFSANTYLIVWIAVVAMACASTVQAVSNIRLVPVAGLRTGTPYSAAALAADPNLANYATYDLVIHLDTNERFTNAEMYTSVDGSSYSTLPGTFYAPQSNAGRIDRDTPQQTIYDASGGENLKYDSWLNTILNTQDPDNNYWGSVRFSELPTDITPLAPKSAIFPRTSDNSLAQGGADVGRHAISIGWGDIGAFGTTYPVPGDYTIAQLTFDGNTTGDWLIGDVLTTTANVQNPFSIQIPTVPEPSIAICTGISFFIFGNRKRRTQPLTTTSAL